VEQVLTLLVNDGNIQVQTNAAKSLYNFFITITEKLNIQHVEKGDVIHILYYYYYYYYYYNRLISWKFPQLKNNLLPKLRLKV
jgi:hypothetical protein